MYGDLLKVDRCTSIGSFIEVCLKKEVYESRNNPPAVNPEYTASIDVQLSMFQFQEIGNTIPPDKAMLINSFIEGVFCEHLYWWCQIHLDKSDTRYKGYDYGIRLFAEYHNIMIDSFNEDISYDGLKRRELRYRRSVERKRNLQKISCGSVPSF